MDFHLRIERGTEGLYMIVFSEEGIEYIAPLPDDYDPKADDGQLAAEKFCDWLNRQ